MSKLNSYLVYYRDSCCEYCATVEGKTPTDAIRRIKKYSPKTLYLVTTAEKNPYKGESSSDVINKIVAEQKNSPGGKPLPLIIC